MKTDEIGRQFLKYYERHGYKPIPGSSLLDDSVPMSFVMSAGMVQFERFSDKVRNSNCYCLIQNCFRYFDLEKIGNSKTHLSLFQMPGAFVFGTIDRRGTVAQVWKLLTETYGIDHDKLVVTYFDGGIVDGQLIPPDMETALAWKEVGVPPTHIIGLSAEHNFWTQTRKAVGQSNSRKRGPNTEVFFDRGIEYSYGHNCFPGCSCGRYIEFSNILFISYQFNEKTGELTALKEPFTEIVIGLERVGQILQGKDTVFEIDSIYPLILQLRTFSKPLPSEDIDTCKLEGILVDHIRALLFLIVDGAPPPGKGGRARLIRILMRELLTSQRLLGISDPGFIRSMAISAVDLYPRLESGRYCFLEYLGNENERFSRTVQSGMRDLEIMLNRRSKNLNDEDMLFFGKKYGLPLSLLRHQMWRKSINNNRQDNNVF